MFVAGLVDESQGRAHAHGRAVGFEDLGVAGEDRHAGPDGGLGQVHRGDMALLELLERLGQLADEQAAELAAGDGGGVRGALAADEDDR